MLIKGMFVYVIWNSYDPAGSSFFWSLMIGMVLDNLFSKASEE